MKRISAALVVSALSVGLPTANAVLIQSNWDPVTGTIVQLAPGVTVGASRADFPTTSGQAMAWQAVTTIGAPGLVVDNVTTCLVAAAGCTAGGRAALGTTFSAGGLLGEYSGSSGGDLAIADFTLTGSITDPAFASSLWFAGGMEYQRLMFSTTFDIDTVLVDIGYSVFAEVTENTSGTLARVAAGLIVGDASTFASAGGAFGLGSIDPVFWATANAGNLYGATSLLDSAIGATGTFAIRPNVEYWIMMIAAANIQFTGVADVGLALNSYADPVFAINDAWLATFGDARPSITIERDRIVAVPEPTTLALLGAGLLGFVFSRRRRDSVVQPCRE